VSSRRPISRSAAAWPDPRFFSTTRTRSSSSSRRLIPRCVRAI